MTVRVWDVATGECVGVMQSFHRLGLNDVAWSPDSLFLATASDDTLVGLWDVITATPVRLLRAHTNHVMCVAFSPRGNLLVSGSMDETLVLWDAVTGASVRRLDAHSEPVSCVQFSRDGTVFVSGSFDGLVRVWDVHTGHCLKTLQRDKPAPVSNVCFSPNSQHLLAVYSDASVALWDVLAARVRKMYSGGHVNAKHCLPVKMATNLPLVAPVSASPSTSSSSSSSQGATAAADGSESSSSSSWSAPPHPPVVLVGSEDGAVSIYHAQSAKPLLKVFAQRDPVLAMDIVPAAAVPVRSVPVSAEVLASGEVPASEVVVQAASGAEESAPVVPMRRRLVAPAPFPVLEGMPGPVLIATAGLHHDPVVRVWCMAAAATKDQQSGGSSAVGLVKASEKAMNGSGMTDG